MIAEALEIVAHLDHASVRDRRHEVEELLAFVELPDALELDLVEVAAKDRTAQQFARIENFGSQTVSGSDISAG
jgi:hypothetical protein